MKTIIDINHGREDVFVVVNEWPIGGYTVWNIGRANFPHKGYIPLVQEGSQRYHVNLNTMRALYVGDERLCLKVLRYAGHYECDENKFNELKQEYHESKD